MLKQVQDTGLYKHVTGILSSETRSSSGLQDSLPDIAASVCCQGAGIFAGNSGSNKYCCRETCVRCYRATNVDKRVTVVSGTVVNGGGEQGVDMLVPLSQAEPSLCGGDSCSYSGMHPVSNDILTALLLALPPETWSGIKDKEVLHEVSGLVSTDSLPPLLQEEVMTFTGYLRWLIEILFAWSVCLKN